MPKIDNAIPERTTARENPFCGCLPASACFLMTSQQRYQQHFRIDL